MNYKQSLSGYDLPVEGTGRPMSPVESACSAASAAQYALTDLLQELRGRLELAMSSSQSVAGGNPDAPKLVPSSQLVASFKTLEDQTTGQIAIVREILGRLTL